MQEKDARVDEHLEVVERRASYMPQHRRCIDGVLRPRLRREVREELDLAQRRRHSDSARSDLAGLVRVNTAAMLNVVRRQPQ